MFILFGEKNITDANGNNLSISEISPEGNQIVLDRSCVDFHLTELANCFRYDVYKFLYCRRKILSSFEDCYLADESDNGWFKKTNFYIQDVSLQDKECEKFLSRFDEIFLMEDIVACFCQERCLVNSNEWWIYDAWHKSSGRRIIAGRGKGVILSRFLETDDEEELSRTILYLKRYGLKENPKIITVNEICSLRHLKTGDDAETILLDWATHLHKKIQTVFSEGKRLKRLANSPILLAALKVATIVSTGILLLLLYGIYDENYQIAKTQSSCCVKNKNILLKLNSENYDSAKQFMTQLMKSQIPTITLQRVAEVCLKNRIKPEQLAVEDNVIKIKTQLSKNGIKRLLKNKTVTIESNSFSQNEYENLLEDKKIEAVVCVKTN